MRVVLAQLTDFPESGRIDIYEYAKALSTLGIDVHVVICRNVASKLPPNLAVHELKLSTNAGPANSLRFAIQAREEILKISKNKKVDVVHLFNPAPATFALGWLLKFSDKRPKIIYDIRTGGIGHGFDAWLINFMARTAPFFADGIITLSSALYQRLFGKRVLFHAIVPLGVATDRYQKIIHSSNKKKHFDFVYIGSLGKNRNLKILLEAFTVVQQQFNQVYLTLIGGGDDMVALQEWVAFRHLEPVITFLPTVPFERVPEMLAKADCGLSFIPVTPWFNPQPPLKTLEYLSSNLPVVATATDSHRELWSKLPPELLRHDDVADFGLGLEFAFQQRSKLKAVDFRSIALKFDWLQITQTKLVPFYRQL